jgi:CRP/FNR family transcriptional regulator, cyclic AMP receptor protein
VDGLASIVSREVWTRVVTVGRPYVFAPGDVLIAENGPVDRVLVLVSGRVKISRLEPDGTFLVLAVRGPGELLGEIALLGHDGRSATVTAIDECQTRMIGAQRFLALVDELNLRDQLLRLAFRRLRQAEHFSAQLTGATARLRVVRGLLHLAAPSRYAADGRASVLDIGLDQREVGQAVSLSRASVAAELARLRADGIVVTQRGRIVITDLPRLRALAGG